MASRRTTTVFICFYFVLLFAVSSTSDTSLHADAVKEYLKQTANEWAGQYLPLAVSPSSPCGRALQSMAASLSEEGSWWAATMVDAWGKSSDGIAFGNWIFNGNYDECVRASSPNGAVEGKYCRIQLMEVESERGGGDARGPKLMSAEPWRVNASWHNALRRLSRQRSIPSIATTPVRSYSTCMPATCTPEELQDSLEPVFIQEGLLPVLHCSVLREEAQFTKSDVAVMAVLTFLLVVVAVASLLDIYLACTKNTVLEKGVLRYLLVFSAYTNLSKLLHISSASPGTITCLHGMRVLSMTWVIWCHQYSVYGMNIANTVDVPKYITGLLEQTVSNGYPGVDTFFFISGILVAYSVLREVKRSNRFNLLIFYVHRLVRLLPPVIIVTALVSTVLRFCSSGPHSHILVEHYAANCQEYWWKEVLLLTNLLYDGGSVCLGQTWYLGVDTQLYLVAPLIILPLYFYPSAGRAWLYLVTISSAVIPATLIYVNNLPPSTLFGADVKEYIDMIYNPPWCRAEPWVAGIWLGYVFFSQGGTRTKITPLTAAVGWSLATVTGLLVVFGMVSYNKMVDPAPYEIMTQVVYGGGHRLAWGAALAWVVFACHNGYGGVVDMFLSHPVWQPLSRLTYTTYLVAMPLQYIIGYYTRTAYYLTHLTNMISTVGAVVLAFPAAALVSLITESPAIRLEKLLLTSASHRAVRKPGTLEEGPGVSQRNLNT